MVKRKRGKGNTWHFSAGEYGEKVMIREDRKGAALRWDFRDPATGERVRPEVHPRMKVRRTRNDPVDPALVAAAETACKRRQRKLADEIEKRQVEQPAAPPRSAVSAATLTVQGGFALFHDPKDGKLPESESARKHHRDSRKFWLAELQPETLWNDVTPAVVEGALGRLKARKQIATATKRLQNLRTVYRWLHAKMRLRGLEDPTLGIEAKELRAGYRERKPRLTAAQVSALRKVLPDLSWRVRLFLTLMIDSGTRAIQARNAMRSGLDAPLEPMPEKVPPHGWFVFPPVKKQRPHLSYLTKRQRHEITEAINGPLAVWEGLYRAGKIPDYPLVPAGQKYDAGAMSAEEWTLDGMGDRALRYMLDAAFKQAGIEKIDRLGFHAIRRAWADYVIATEGMDAMFHAGGWARRETAQGYVSEYQHEDIDKARKRMEAE